MDTHTALARDKGGSGGRNCLRAGDLDFRVGLGGWGRWAGEAGVCWWAGWGSLMDKHTSCGGKGIIGVGMSLDHGQD